MVENMTTQRTRNPGAFGEVLEELMRARDLEPYPENVRRREGRSEEAQGGRPMLVTADGSKVRALREARESSTREFAKKAGVSRRTLTRVERNEGPVRPGTARKIGSALEVDPRTFARAVSSRPA
jgi:DNA-binding XRE family transcriptional regulator